MGGSREFFSIHMNLFCPWNTYTAWEYFNDLKKKMHWGTGKNFGLTSSFYFWGSETWKSEANCPRSFRKVTANPSLEFMSLDSRYSVLQITSNYFPMKVLAKNKPCAKRYLMTKLFSSCFLHNFGLKFSSSLHVESFPEQGLW